VGLHEVLPLNGLLDTYWFESIYFVAMQPCYIFHLLIFDLIDGGVAEQRDSSSFFSLLFTATRNWSIVILKSNSSNSQVSLSSSERGKITHLRKIRQLKRNVRKTNSLMPFLYVIYHLYLGDRGYQPDVLGCGYHSTNQARASKSAS